MTDDIRRKIKGIKWRTEKLFMVCSEPGCPRKTWVDKYKYENSIKP